jgi:diaminobutyrate-2-oxoglutarate transaminase
MQGVDVGSGDLAGEICSHAYENGLIIETSGSEDQVIKVLAPLTTSKDTLRKGFNILLDAANDVLNAPNKIAAE